MIKNKTFTERLKILLLLLFIAAPNFYSTEAQSERKKFYLETSVNFKQAMNTLITSHGIEMDENIPKDEVKLRMYFKGFDSENGYKRYYHPQSENNLLFYGIKAYTGESGIQSHNWVHISAEDNSPGCNSHVSCRDIPAGGDDTVPDFVCQVEKLWHFLNNCADTWRARDIYSDDISKTWLAIYKAVSEHDGDFGLSKIAGDLSDVQLDMVVEIDTKPEMLDYITGIHLPGADSVVYTKEDFTAHIQDVKGINFMEIPVKIAADVSLVDIHSASNINQMQEDFNITETSETNIYKMLFPRSIVTTQGNVPPRTTAYATNVAVYPLYDTVNEYYYAYFVTSVEDHSDINTLIGDESGVLQESSYLCTVDDDETYYLHKVSFSSDDRVLVTNIDATNGPFPAVSGRFNILQPEVNDINRKMLAKKDYNDNYRYLVAWHRGYWQHWPENTLESIKASKGWDLLELDISKTASFHDNGVPEYVLFHDTFMFRESSIGPSDSCVDPYDKLLVPSTLLSMAQRENLKDELETRFPGYLDSDYDDWLKGMDQFTMDQLNGVTVRDRFGCLTNINIPTLDDAIASAQSVDLPIMVDKGQDNIDGIYWHAIEADYENNMFFKGGPERNTKKLTNLYGDELFTQIAFTPYVFDSTAQPSSAIDGNGNVKALQTFIDKERWSGWHIPGVELQIKHRVSDGSSVDDGYAPQGTERLLAFKDRYKDTKWIGITQINPTAINGFDNKIIFMDQPATPAESNPYSSRHDRRADPDFCFYYLEADYYTTDRPDIMLLYLKAQGKIPDVEIRDE